MENNTENRNGRRVILFPQPLQGCINPMLQLAKILYSRGFSITVIHTRFNAPKASNHPLFTFLEISDGLSESHTSTQNVTSLLMLLNRSCESPFRECLAKLLSAGGSGGENRETVACLIDDCGWLFTHTIAESLKLPRIVLQTFKGSFFVGLTLFPDLRRKGYLPVTESEAESIVPEFLPLKKKDLLTILTENSEELEQNLLIIIKSTKASSGLIFTSCEELDQDSLNRANEVFQVPIFPIGPLHCYFPASSSSLFKQDETCIPWLDKQAEKSVIYVSLGSVVTISESEFLEIAWGLSNSGQPFLWVIRPGLVRGSKWIEPLPKGLLESLEGKGKIVKWAPQQDVLTHRATGGFWTHGGWNSTLESICEGVPMICQPCGWDQTLNARFVSDIWRVGLHLENRIERHEIERVIRRLMVEQEGEEFRKKIKVLKDKVREFVGEGGLSYKSLEDLVNRILSL